MKKELNNIYVTNGTKDYKLEMTGKKDVFVFRGKIKEFGKWE